MPKTLFGMIALFSVLMLAPFASAQNTTQQSSDPNNNAVFENVCALGFDTEFEESLPFAMDYQQLENVRIELLERGFNPGFNSELDSANHTQLMEALRQFQSEYQVPMSGQIDASTLAALSIPIQKSGSTISEEPQRAKPSQSHQR